MKKLIFALLSCTLLLTSCGTSSVEPVTTPAPVEEAPEESEPAPEVVEEPEEPIEESDPKEPVDVADEVSPEQFVSDVQSAIQGDVGSGETITDVKLDGGKLYVYVDFSQGDFSTFSAADIARSRTSSITDDILALDQYDSLWDSIIVDFGSVGYIENSHKAIKDEGYGRFFDLDSSFSKDNLDDNFVISKAEASSAEQEANSSTSTRKSASSSKKETASNLSKATTDESLAQTEPAPAEIEPQPEETAPVEEPPAPEPEEEQPKPVMVWLSATGEKYHSINNCGRMNPDNARQVTLEDAISMGKERCSKCF